MTHRFVLTAALAALLSVGSPALRAADREDPAGDWGNLARLTPGQRIEVIDRNLKRTRGVFRGSSAEELQIETAPGHAAGVTTIPKAQVFRISLTEKSKRLRNAVIGMAAGAAAGLVTGALVDRSFSEDDENIAKMLFVPIGIGAGAGIGAAAPGFQTIYRAKSRNAAPAATGSGKP